MQSEMSEGQYGSSALEVPHSNMTDEGTVKTSGLLNQPEVRAGRLPCCPPRSLSPTACRPEGLPMRTSAPARSRYVNIFGFEADMRLYKGTSVLDLLAERRDGSPRRHASTPETDPESCSNEKM